MKERTRRYKNSFLSILPPERLKWGISVWPEYRVQTTERHFRIPDVCATRADASFERIICQAPLLCIEVMSHEDRMSEILERVEDYLMMGVSTVWVVDPRRRRVFIADGSGVQQVTEQLFVTGTAIEIPVADVFVRLDALEGREP